MGRMKARAGEAARGRASESRLVDLYQTCNRGLRFWFAKQVLPQDVDDCVHDTWLAMAEAIERDQLRDPARLMGYLKTIARRQVFRRIGQYCRQRTLEPLEFTTVVDGCSDPERQAIRRQESEIAAKILRTLSPRDQELIERGFMRAEPPEVTSQALGIDVKTYHVEKSRAKYRFAKRVQRRLQRPRSPGRSINANPSSGTPPCSTRPGSPPPSAFLACSRTFGSTP